MHRLPVIAVLFVALNAVAGVAAAQTADPTAPPPLAATLETCSTSALPAERAAEFVGAMPATATATRMRMRFDLERLRPRDAHWRRLRGVPGFGTWEQSAPDRAGFVFHKRVDGLLVPASYRAVVRFRWVDARGRLLRQARRRTLACAQPDMRPNLVPGALTGNFAAQPGLALYTLVVRNAGRSTAGPFSVRVAGGTAEVESLGPGESQLVGVVAGICLAGTSTDTQVDSDNRVEESSERGNAAPRRCPLWGA